MANESNTSIGDFDLTLGMDFDVTPDEVRHLASGLAESEAFEAEEAPSEVLAEYVSALKELESVAEDARKDVFEDELKDRVETGSTIGNLTKTSGTNRWITDHAAAFDAVMDAGVDPREVAKVSVSDFQDVLGVDADEYIDEAEYEYFRRQT